ncbi:hypothetical protein [Polaromonas hydrogenivorans]
MKMRSQRKSGNQEQSRLSAFAFYRFMNYAPLPATLAFADHRELLTMIA